MDRMRGTLSAHGGTSRVAGECLSKQAWQNGYLNWAKNFADVNYCSLCAGITCRVCMAILVNDYTQALISQGIMLDTSEASTTRINVCRKCIVGPLIKNFADVASNVVLQKMSMDISSEIL